MSKCKNCGQEIFTKYLHKYHLCDEGKGCTSPNLQKEYAKLSNLLVKGRMAGVVDWT